MWPHDTSIGRRLTLGFGFNFLLVLLLIGVYFYGQQRQNEAFRRLADQVMPMSEAARDIETAYLRQSDAAGSYIYSGEDRHLAEYRQAVALAQEATERLNRLPLRPEGRALFQQIQRLAAHYTEEAGKAIALRQQGEVVKAKRALQREMLRIREELLEKTGAYVALQLRRRDEAKSEVDRVRTEMAWTSVALSLLILGFGALVSFFVSRSVSGPARTLSQASRALSRGDFDPALNLASELGDVPPAQTARDELRVLTAAFGSMARELLRRENRLSAQSEEIQAQNEELQRQNEEIQTQEEEIHAQSDELLARREALEEADRRKDEFLAMLAHELRNPLGALSNVVEVARLHGASDPACSQVHTILNRQVRHMARLLDDLLDVSRITRGKVELRKERVDLAAVVAHAVETTRPLIEAREQKLQISLPAEPVQLEADPTRLEQVLVNLLDNAAKYTGHGGRISLTAEREETGTVLRVRDSGVGIPLELLPRVFDLFTQGDRSMNRSQGGLGIGLTMVRSLVEMHGGSVEAHSAGPGKGSELVVRLPALPASSASKISAFQPMVPGEAQGRTQRILVVDDNVDAAQMLALCLETWGHQVRVVHNGPAAIEAAMADHPEIVLLDIGLPGMDGYEVARRLRQQVGLSEARLVAMTGYAQEDARTRSRETGFDHHLVKPIPLAELQQLLATLSKGP